jgi:hypothetical protein
MEEQRFFQAFFISFKVASITTICPWSSPSCGDGLRAVRFQGQNKVAAPAALAQLFPLVLPGHAVLYHHAKLE